MSRGQPWRNSSAWSPAQIAIVCCRSAAIAAGAAASCSAISIANPFAAEQNAAVEQARAQLRALERSYFPTFFCKAPPMHAAPAPKSTAADWAD